MSKLQTVPYGYLSALGIKSTGRNPPDITDFVQPVFDMGPYYRSALTSVDFVTGAIAAVGDTVNLFVPDGEAWILRAIAFGLSGMAAGDTYQLALRVQMPGAIAAFGPTLATSGSLQTVAAAGGGEPCHLWLGEGMMFRAGTEFIGALGDGVLAASRTGVLQVLLERIAV